MQVQILMLFNSGFIFSELCLYISIFFIIRPLSQHFLTKFVGLTEVLLGRPLLVQ